MAMRKIILGKNATPQYAMAVIVSDEHIWESFVSMVRMMDDEDPDHLPTIDAIMFRSFYDPFDEELLPIHVLGRQVFEGLTHDEAVDWITRARALNEQRRAEGTVE